MKCPVTIAVTGFVTMVVVGCAQGVANAPSGSTDLTTSPGRSGERAMTAEQTTYTGMRGLQCPEYGQEGAVFDYALGIGEKASPVEQARRRFSKRIEEGDKVEVADDQGGATVGYYGEELRTVRVVRDGRVVALMHYKEGRGAGGGWLLDSYEACGEF
jgi:hypothetical protein